jgi:hypothetical protein
VVEHSRRSTPDVINPIRLSLTCLAFVSPIVARSQALWHYFKQAWWSGEKANHFFFRSDWDENFRDQDKFGHLLGGYQLTRVGYEALTASCVSNRKALPVAVAYAAFFQLQVKVSDGMYKKYGFSYADMIANTTGQTLAASYWPSLFRASIGHSITDYIDPVTGVSHRARRKLLLSIDIDPEKLPGENPLWKAVKHQLSYYHFPSPTLQLTPSFRGLNWYR